LKALTFLVLIFSALNSFAQNSLLDSHRSLCEGLDADTCRLVIIPQKIQEKMGVCQGILMGSIPCVVSYGVEATGSAMNLTCGADLDNPEINQDITSSAIDYKVAAIINSQSFKVEEARFTNVSSPLMSLNITESSGDLIHTVELNLEGGVFPLENIRCQ
jgi:hypothetical protein